MYLQELKNYLLRQYPHSVIEEQRHQYQIHFQGLDQPAEVTISNQQAGLIQTHTLIEKNVLAKLIQFTNTDLKNRIANQELRLAFPKKEVQSFQSVLNSINFKFNETKMQLNDPQHQLTIVATRNQLAVLHHIQAQAKNYLIQQKHIKGGCNHDN